MIEKENVVLEAGNSMLDGANAACAKRGPSVRTRTLVAETRRERAARGRGVGCGVSTSATASGGNHWQCQGRWEFGEHVCGSVTLGLPLSDTRLLGHAAARISCSKNLDSKNYFCNRAEGGGR
jgi:hypothetical protein